MNEEFVCLDSDANRRRRSKLDDDLARRRNRDLPKLDNYDRCCKFNSHFDRKGKTNLLFQFGIFGTKVDNQLVRHSNTKVSTMITIFSKKSAGKLFLYLSFCKSSSFFFAVVHSVLFIVVSKRRRAKLTPPNSFRR